MLRIAEFVGRGHPDKMADRLADQLMEIVVGTYPDKGNTAGIEVILSNEHVTVAGEVCNLDKLTDFQRGRINGKIRRRIMTFLEEEGYDPKTFKVILNLNSQSYEIKNYSQGEDLKLLSGDQSISFGFASKCEFKPGSNMPSEFEIAKAIVKNVEQIQDLGSDCKCMVVIDDKHCAGRFWLEEIVVSVSHRPEMTIDQVRKLVKEYAIDPVIRRIGNRGYDTKIYINSGGSFTTSGLHADTGVTNRKLMASSYGTRILNGGGGLYGKSLDRVDRLGAYWARFICNQLVYTDICESIQIGVYFMPGSDKPKYFVYDFTIKPFKWNGPATNKTFEEAIEKIYGKYTYSEIYHFFKPFATTKGLARFTQDCHFGNEQREYGDPINWESLLDPYEIETYFKKLVKN